MADSCEHCARYDLKTVKVILRACEIPDNATVTKVTGRKPYRIVSEIRFYGDRENYPDVKADKGIRFLISDGGAINIISADTELKWELTPHELVDFFRESGIEIY